MEFLSQSVDECCIHIQNVFMLPQDQSNKMKKVTKDSEAIFAVLKTNWLGKVLMCLDFL